MAGGASNDEAGNPARSESRAAAVPAVHWRWRAFDALSGAELYAALALRSAVFVVEQACVFLDADGYDLHAHHLLGFASGGEEVLPPLIAYLRVLAPGRKYVEPSIGRVIAASPHRRAGLGRALMLEGLRRARSTYPGLPLRVGAQEHLRPFYESLGFRVASSVYVEDGIPHVEMLLEEQRTLAAAAPRAP